LEHTGDVFPCDHYVYPDNKLGNLLQTHLASLATSSWQRAFANQKHERLPPECLRCEVGFACNGECPKNRFAPASDGGRSLNYVCPAYKLFFTHIDKYMKFMAQELRENRAPANVMKWVRNNFWPAYRGV
jgi:uncharacterized protein